MAGVEHQEPVPAIEPAVEGLAVPTSPASVGFARTLATGDPTRIVGYLAAAAAEPRAEVVKGLQRTVGNYSVTRMLAPSAGRSAVDAPATPSAEPLGQPLARCVKARRVARATTVGAPPGGPASSEAISPEVEEQMRGDVDFIVSKLQEELLTPGEEQQIVTRIEHWDMADHRRLVDTGAPGTPHLDKLLFLLKTRTFTRSTASSFWIEQHANAFDELWRELEDDRLTQFSVIVARSRKHAAAGPSSGPTENFWSTMGKQEAMGALGIVKGLVMGATGLVDAGAGGITALLKTAGVDAADPPKVAEWFGQQYDIMGRAGFGTDWDQSKIIGNQTAGDIGTFGGKAIWQLVMIGAGGQLSAGAKGAAAGNWVIPAGQAAARVQVALAALGLLGSLQGVREAALGIEKVLKRLEAADKLTAEAVLTDPEFLVHMTSLAAAIFGAISSGGGLGGGGGPSTPEQQEAARWAAARMGALLELSGAAVHLGTVVQIYLSEATPQEKEAAYTEAIQKFLEKVIGAAGQLAGAHDEDTVDAKQAAENQARADQRAAADQEKQARYEAAVEKARPAAEARAEARKAAEAGGGGGNVDAPGDGGGGGGGGGGHEDLFGPRDSWIGGGDVLEPHPGGGDNPPEYIPHPEALAEVDRALVAAGVDGMEMFRKLPTADRQRLVANIVSDFTPKAGVQADMRQAGITWAAQRANGNAYDFANRYEFFKTQFLEGAAAAKVELGKPGAKAPAGGAARIAADRLNTAEGMAALDTAYAAHAQAVRSLPPGPTVTPGLKGDALTAAVQALDRINPPSESSGAYHPRKHAEEVPGGVPRGDPDKMTKAYYDKAAETVQKGKCVSSGPDGASTKLVFHHDYPDVGTVESIVHVRPDGTVSMSSFGDPKAVKVKK